LNSINIAVPAIAGIHIFNGFLNIAQLLDDEKARVATRHEIAYKASLSPFIPYHSLSGHCKRKVLRFAGVQLERSPLRGLRSTITLHDQWPFAII
jgi:hypothetical protein